MDVILTGATGFVGSNLLRLLLKETDVHVTAVIRPASLHKNRLPIHPKLDIVELAPEHWAELPKSIGRAADVFVDSMWRGTRGTDRNNEEMQAQNVKELAIAFQCARHLGCRVFVGMGSQAEYGPQRGPTREDTHPIPDTAYGKAKLEAFRYCMDEGKKHGMSVYWPRIFSAYGPDDFEGTLLMHVAQKMQRNEPILLTACTQLWDFVYIDDVACAIRLLMSGEAEPGAYNVAFGDVRPLREYLEEMKLVLHSGSELQYGAVPSPLEGLAGICPDVEKLRRLGWYAQVPFRKGVQYLNGR